MPDQVAPATLGFSPHSGWVAAVCLGGPASSPVVLERRRILLTSGPLPCEPYHWAKCREGVEARQIVEAAAEEARKLAAAAVQDLVLTAAKGGHEIMCGCVITGRGRPDFSFQQALSTHAAMHNAEGWLFREALMEAGGDLGLRTTGVAARGLYAETAAAAGFTVSDIGARIRELGVPFGPPWGKDEKLSAAAAWLGLAR